MTPEAVVASLYRHFEVCSSLTGEQLALHTVTGACSACRDWTAWDARSAELRASGWTIEADARDRYRDREAGHSPGLYGMDRNTDTSHSLIATD